MKPVAPGFALALAVAAIGCGGVTARDGETLPGRTRPLLEHSWTHPRDLRFAVNRFAPPDPASVLVTAASGLRAYVVPDAGDPIVEISAAIPLGRAVEQSGEAGAAEALTRLLSDQITTDLGAAFVGRVQVDPDVDLTRVTVQTIADAWQPALAAVIGAIRQPRYDRAAADSLRTGPGFARQTRGLGGPAFRPAVELARLVAAYPLAPPDPGVAVRADALRSLASRALRPSTVVLGIGGGVSREDAARELETRISGWQPAAAAAGDRGSPDAAVRASTDRSRLIEEPGYTTWIAVGHAIPKIAAADEAAVAIMTDVVNIRLNIAVREIRGLANQAVLQVSATTGHDGLLHVRTGARPESVAPLIRYALQELSRIREATGAPAAEELEQVKGGLVLGKWQALLDSARDVSATYAVEAARHGSVDRLMRWPAAVHAVTAKDVTDAAARYIRPDAMAAVVIGQLEAVRKARHPRWPAALDEVLPGSARIH
jgi:zinc protease